MQPIGGFGGLNRAGGQYSFERSKGGRMGGGDPFDQTHVGHGGSGPVGKPRPQSSDIAAANRMLRHLFSATR
jgi:hypothetical protein